MTAWLELAPVAFDRKATARPVPALFGRDEAHGLEGALFELDGEPVAGAVAPEVERRAALVEDLRAERAELLARLAEIDAMLSA